ADGGDRVPGRPRGRRRRPRVGPGADGGALMRGLSREAAFVIVCGVLVAVTLGYVGFAALHPSASPSNAAATTASDPELRSILAQPHLVFLKPSGADPTQDVVSVAPLQKGTDVRVETGLRCQRVYFAAGHGVCVGRDMLGAGFFFDDRFVAGRGLSQPGITSR